MLLGFEFFNVELRHLKILILKKGNKRPTRFDNILMIVVYVEIKMV